MFEKVRDRLARELAKRTVMEDQMTGPEGFAPNTKIAYKPTLVSTLEEEHKQLLLLYGQILSTAKRGKTDKARELLTKFKGLFVDHVLKENTSLYIYLSHTAKQTSQGAVKSVKAEMDKIGRDVMRVLDSASSETSILDDRFIAEFEKIGKSLTKRIYNEEEFVYPNYQPNNRPYQRQENT